MVPQIIQSSRMKQPCWWLGICMTFDEARWLEDDSRLVRMFSFFSTSGQLVFILKKRVFPQISTSCSTHFHGCIQILRNICQHGHFQHVLPKWWISRWGKWLINTVINHWTWWCFNVEVSVLSWGYPKSSKSFDHKVVLKPMVAWGSLILRHPFMKKTEIEMVGWNVRVCSDKWQQRFISSGTSRIFEGDTFSKWSWLDVSLDLGLPRFLFFWEPQRVKGMSEDLQQTSCSFSEKWVLGGSPYCT
jgi:hypothetical protein